MVSKVHLNGILPKQLCKLLPLKKLPRRAPSRASIPSLPTELYVLILAQAARPSFLMTDSPWFNPYSSALVLCRICRTFRRIVLPELLHTVVLLKAKHLLAFMYALQMQRAHAQQQNHLHFDYAAHVDRSWIGNTSAARSRVNAKSCLHSVDFDLLAPVLLASNSLAVDYAAMFLLDGCLEHALNAHIHSNIDHKSSPQFWNVKTLTLSGDLDSYWPTSTAEGHAFLASISHINFFPSDKFLVDLPLQGFDIALHYEFPEFPWSSLKSLQSVSLALPYCRFTVWHFASFSCGSSSYAWYRIRRPIRVELLTIPVADLPSGCWARRIPGGYARRKDGRISSVDFCRTAALHSGVTSSHELQATQQWEWFRIWAAKISST